MKIRSGFVSNSSSSSFCLYGRLIREVRIEFADIVDSKISDLGLRLNYVNDSSNDRIYIGLNPFDMEMDETKAEFIKNVDSCIEQLLADEGVKKFLAEEFPSASIESESDCHEGVIYG